MDIYIDNKYTRWYYLLVNNAKNQNRIKYKNSYYEKHHIIPKSLGGDNTSSNLVLLTYKEHFLCHWLLIKMCCNNQHIIKMCKAFKRMTDINDFQERICQSWRIELVKRHASDAQYQRWQDPEYRSKMKLIKNTTEYKSNLSEQSKNRWLNDDYRNQVIQTRKETNLKPEIREKRSKISKEINSRPEVIEKNRLGVTEAWKDIEKRQKRIHNMTISARSDKRRKNNSEAQRRPEVVEKKTKSLAKTNQAQETKTRRSNAQKEVLNRPGAREKLSQNAKRQNQENRLICPYCNKDFDIMNAKKWHFDNCKKRKYLLISE
jgi:hypothetical protein